VGYFCEQKSEKEVFKMIKRTSLKELENWKPEEWKMPRFTSSDGYSSEDRRELWDKYHSSPAYRDGYFEGASKRNAKILDALFKEEVSREVIAKVMDMEISSVVAEQQGYLGRKIDNLSTQITSQKDQIDCLEIEIEYLDKLFDKLTENEVCE
jgi:hypothetical protein